MSEPNRKEQVARTERLLATLQECAQWHQDASNSAREGAKGMRDPMLKLGWNKMADDHQEQGEKIRRAVDALRFEL